MAEYIEREALISAIEDECPELVYYSKRDAIDCVKAEPTGAASAEDCEVAASAAPTRASILDAAKRCVTGAREQDYGSPEDNFKLIGLLWGAYLRAAHPGVTAGPSIDAKDVALMMALLKVARAATGRGTADCYVDLAGYAACGGEIEARRSRSREAVRPADEKAVARSAREQSGVSSDDERDRPEARSGRL